MSYSEKLNVPSFTEYSKNISELNYDELNETKDEFILVLRPLFWHSSMPFEDVYELLFKTASELLKHPKHSEYGITKYIGSIVTENPINVSGWKFLASSPEIAAAVDLEELANTSVGESKELFNTLAKTFKDIEGIKHKVNQLLKNYGENHLELIGQVIHDIIPDDQSFILHGIRFGEAKEKIKEFLKQYISESNYSHLKEEAQDYFERIA